MNSNGLAEKHWARVLFSCLTDSALFAIGYLIAIRLRHADEWDEYLANLWPAIAIGSLAISAICYIAGLYARHPEPRRKADELLSMGLRLTAAQAFIMILLILTFYFNFSTRIGRGTMLIGAFVTWLLLLIHHLMLRRHLMTDHPVRILYVMTSRSEEEEAGLLQALDRRSFLLVGIVHDTCYRPSTNRWPVLGTADDLLDIVARERIDRVICASDGLNAPDLRDKFCYLRYSGVTVMAMLTLCEEVFQCVPIPLVTPGWLLSASGSPQIQYIKKLKRASDIVLSIIGLIVLSPALLAGALAVRLTSPGPIIYRQWRCGRFGKPFELFKLRSMTVDAEKEGAVWSQRADQRVTPVGRFLRKYRIDEIPQLINVLRGEMSFVGPRPERPEFVDMLAREIPFFRERLMIHPGITGWAQVSFPYGATVDDARRKLEYDLYYLKHMGLFLDVFILLDTCRTVLTGSLWKHRSRDLSALLGQPATEASPVPAAHAGDPPRQRP